MQNPLILVSKPKHETNDPTFRHPAVQAYCKAFNLCPSIGWRRDIIATIEDDGEVGLNIWQTIVSEWGYWKNGKWIRRNPMAISALIQEYERARQQ